MKICSTDSMRMKKITAVGEAEERGPFCAAAVALLELQLNEKNVELSSIYKRLEKNENMLWDLKNSIIQANFFIVIFSYAMSFMGLCLMYLMFNAYVFFSLFLLMSPFLFKTAIAISIMEVIYSYLGYDMSAKKKVVEKKILKTLGNRLGSKRISEILENVTVNEDDEVRLTRCMPQLLCLQWKSDAIAIDRYTKKHLKIGDSRYPMPVETNLFKGKIIVSFRGNERLDHGSISQRGYFEGRNRISACFVQGKFKEKIAVKEVLTGQSFGTNLVNLPSKFLIQMLFGVLNRISNMVADVACQNHTY